MRTIWREFEAACGAEIAELFEARAVGRRVQFCGDDNDRLLRKFFAERGKLPEIISKSCTGSRSEASLVSSNAPTRARALDVAQKRMP